MLLSVVVDMELVHLDGWRSCRTAVWVKNGGRVRLLLNCELDVDSNGVEHGGLLRSSVAVESRWEASYKVPYFSFVMWCRSTSSRSQSVHNQWQLLGSIVKDQPPYFEISFIYGGESQSWFGYLRILGGIPKYACQTLFLNPFFRVVMTHFSRQQCQRKKVLHCSYYVNIPSTSDVIPKLKDKLYNGLTTHSKTCHDINVHFSSTVGVSPKPKLYRYNNVQHINITKFINAL